MNATYGGAGRQRRAQSSALGRWRNLVSASKASSRSASTPAAKPHAMCELEASRTDVMPE
jgi:hypothetical protein